MCTAIVHRKGGFVFGRNLDYERGFGEKMVMVPRGYRTTVCPDSFPPGHLAIQGIAAVFRGYPLFYDAVNEAGVCMAGLNFVGNAVYEKPLDGAKNVPQFALIPWLLGRCDTVAALRRELAGLRVTDTPFSQELPTAELHWMVADREECIVIESTSRGIEIYQNPLGVLTNNPPFLSQCDQVRRFFGLSPQNPVTWEGTPGFDSRGMGAVGLPGDWSSPSRFARAAYLNHFANGGSVCGAATTAQHILDSVKQVRGCCITEGGEEEYTRYSVVYDLDGGVCRLRTYAGQKMQEFPLDAAQMSGGDLKILPLEP